MRPMFASRVAGATYTEPSIPPALRLSSCCQRCAMLRRPNACSAGLSAIHPIRNPASSTPIRHAGEHHGAVRNRQPGNLRSCPDSERITAHREVERDFSNMAYFQTREPVRPDKAQDTVTLWLLWWLGRETGVVEDCKAGIGYRPSVDCLPRLTTPGSSRRPPPAIQTVPETAFRLFAVYRSNPCRSPAASRRNRNSPSRRSVSYRAAPW